ncbi:MAG: NUDIX domain-containing protein [Phycisphaerales bacterium]
MTEPNGPRVRTDLIDVYLFRQFGPGDAQFLQMRRSAAAAVAPLMWHPVMGRIESDETAIEAAMREVQEEVGLRITEALGFWQLEQIHPFYLAERDEIFLSPRFAVQVDGRWSPILNEEHEEYRWTALDRVPHDFVWPGQKAAIQEIMSEIAGVEATGRDTLRIRI